MKAKEKAKELVDKIYYDIDFDLVGMPNTKKMVAKQCALIAVDEMIKILPYSYSETRFYLDELEKEIIAYKNES